ncbi:hypothetical protein SDC9_136448 [bioreactor metagenome]|uniref:DNA binding HTH domain-containing protein n=1 Tax=bioreactor metagenome TaxID=1076179 RepID=A0A645DJ58_9ZZZZ
MRLNWPGLLGSGDGDGLLCLDEDGRVTGANPVARQIVSGLAGAGGPLHSDELFAMPAHLLFDAALRGGAAASMEVPLWSGLRVQLSTQLQAPGVRAAGASLGKVDAGALPLKDLELALVRQAVADARGNVAEAARALGISRATVYRKLGRKPVRR